MICAEERCLIDAKIGMEKIPFPKKIPTQRQRVDFDVSLVDRAIVMQADEDAPSSQSETFRKGRGGLLDWQRVFGLAGLNRLSQDILAHAGPGPIVIVSARPEAILLSYFLRRHGRRSVTLAPGYGRDAIISPGYLARPAKNSLIGWVLDHADDLDNVGAIAFLGELDFTADIETLTAAQQTSTVLFASPADRGRYKIERVHPCGFRHNLGTGDAPIVRLSIVIVSYNQAAYLEAAIRSVIMQEYPDLELIIVDGGSTDGSIEIIEKYRPLFTHVVIEPDDGQSDALNKGFSRATGEVMNWLCSDDLFEPGAFTRVKDAYLATGADLIVGGCIRIGETRTAEIVRHHTALVVGRKVQLDAADILDFMRSWERGTYFFQPEVFFSRRIWEASGGYIKKHLYYAMDYDLWLRMSLAEGSVYHIPAMIACSRVHPRQKTRASAEYMHQMAQLVEEYQDLLAALEAADRASDQAGSGIRPCEGGR
jgi:hypothetical protein